MSRLTNLLRQLEKQDSELAADLRHEVDALSGRRAFGLNFERHIPETVELPGRQVRKGDKVQVPVLGGARRCENALTVASGGLARIRRSAEWEARGRLGPATTTSRREPRAGTVEDSVVVVEFR